MNRVIIDNINDLSGSNGSNIDISTLATESTLTDVKVAVQALDYHYYNAHYKNDLRVLRSEGSMFSSTQFLNVLNNTYQYVLFNPANSNKILYCNECGLSIKKSTNNYTLICALQKITGFSGGQQDTPINMKFSGTTNQSVAQVFRNISGVSGNSTFYMFQVDDTGTSNFIKEWHEYIEIQPGFGIAMFIQNTEGGESICPVFRWFELSF